MISLHISIFLGAESGRRSDLDLDFRACTFSGVKLFPPQTPQFLRVSELDRKIGLRFILTSREPILLPREGYRGARSKAVGAGLKIVGVGRKTIRASPTPLSHRARVCKIEGFLFNRVA